MKGTGWGLKRRSPTSDNHSAIPSFPAHIPAAATTSTKFTQYLETEEAHPGHEQSYQVDQALALKTHSWGRYLVLQEKNQGRNSRLESCFFFFFWHVG